MALLDRLRQFEERVKTLVEGGPLGILSTNVRFEQIISELEQQLEANIRTLNQQIWVPDVYWITLHPDDYAKISSKVQIVTLNLVEHVIAYVNDRGYNLNGYPRPLIDAHASVRRGNVRIATGTQGEDDAYRSPDQSSGQAWNRDITIEAQGQQGRRIMQSQRQHQGSDMMSVEVRVFLRAEAQSSISGGASQAEQSGVPLMLSQGGYQLGNKRVRLGRDLGNDIPIADLHVSRSHAWIYWKGGYYWLHNMTPANGTYRNGERLGDNEEIILQHGDIISLGRTDIQFAVED
jgi:hypothetical protein